MDPYISQRSSDLYITNGETTDHAYNKYGSMAWTPELDECETAAGGTFCSGGSGFTFPDDEGKVEAVFEKNLDFARNVAATTLDRDRPDRPRNATDDETQYQVKGSPDIEPNRFDVSFGAEQTLEATARRILGPVDFVVQAQTGPGGNSRTLTLRAQPWRGGERFGDLRGKYYQRVRAAVPASFTQPGTTQTPRPLVAGDIVNVRVIAGSQQQRFSYRVQSTRPAGDAKRVLVVAAEDYTGLSPNKLPYDDAPRYLDAHVAALEANGYAVETFDVDAPPLGPDGEPGAKLVNDLGVLSHFDAVVFYTGDDLVPQAPGEGVTAENFRRGGPATGGAFALTGSTHLTNWGVRNAHMLRNFMNDGGKVLLAGRNLWVQQTAYQTAFNPPPQQGGLNSYSGYSWWQDPVYDFDYPPNQAGDDDRPHTAFFRELDMPNDWGQWWLGFGHRTGGAGTTTLNAAAVEPAAGGILAGMGPIALDTSLGSGGTLEPTEDAVTGRADPRPKAPTRLRAISTQILPPATQRPFRQETIQADYAGQPNAFGGAVISTRDSVSVGFGLEQITDPAVREELVGRAMAYLLPDGADTIPPTVTWLRPGDGATVDAADPVEIEVEPVDERGDMREVRLVVDGAVVQTKVSFPYQLRWQPAPGDVGATKTLTVEAEDAAGNVTTSARTITVGPANAPEEAPLPTGVTTLAGTPVAGGTLTCVPSGFTGGGITLGYAWLRDGTPVAGATGATYVASDADIGHAVACVVTARNAAGVADSTSAPVTVSAAAAGPAGPPGPPGPAGPRGPRGRTAEVRVTCRVVGRRQIRCTVRTRGRATAAVRLAGTRLRASARGRERFAVRLLAPRALRRPARVVVRIQAGSATVRGTVRTGRTVTLVAKR